MKRKISFDKKLAVAILAIASAVPLFAQEWSPAPWPVMKHYDRDHLYQIALPLGGIGTGTVSLGGRGELRDWEIMNVPAKKYSGVKIGNDAPFFAIYVKPEGGKAITTMLEGPLYDQEYLDQEGSPVNNHGMPRFRDASFDAAYPLGQVHLSDKNIPVQVTIKGFNPLVPCDAEASGLPIAVISYKVKNMTSRTMEVSVCGSIRNFIGEDGSKYRKDWKGDYIFPTGAKSNRNKYIDGGKLKGIYFYSDSVNHADPAWGTMALTTEASRGVSFRTSSCKDDWNNAILNFWDDFSDDGSLQEQQPSGEDDPMASLSVKKQIAPNESETFTFYLTWSFPNRKSWSKTVVGNYYCTKYPDAWKAAEDIVPKIPALEKKTLQFVNTLAESSYPDVIKEAALFNLSALRSQTTFRLPDGHLMGWEGVFDRIGSCFGSCTHVWNYEVATPFLFGDLAKSMRDVEFNYATKDNGQMNFRVSLPLQNGKDGYWSAADGQMGCVMKMYREWQLSGDNAFLKNNWAQLKKVLSYAWVKDGWDGNQDGVMEGAQGNTMDVSYYGPNPQMGFWYTGALRAAEKMADAVNDKAFGKKCKSLFLKGSKWMDDNLFNGEYYEQRITDPATHQYLDMNSEKTVVPKFQLGRGCLVDQLVGQYMSDICGLGNLGNQAHLHKTMESIMKYNYLSDFSGHFNNMRSFVLGDEAGLLMASWPNGRLKVPFPYFSEVMTGFEYSAITEMIYQGMTDEALKCAKSIRDRYDGAKRNPFSEPECGHHYARSMASWSMVIAWSDFHYSGIEKTMNFTSRTGTYFWSNGYSWGKCTVSPHEVLLEVLGGSLNLKKLTLSGRKEAVAKNIELKEGEAKTFEY